MIYCISNSISYLIPKDVMNLRVPFFNWEILDNFSNKIRNEEDQVVNQTAPIAKTVKITSKCNPDKVYIITGGLGGFGLELATWLVDKGARKLVLSSRSGIKNGYQARKVKFLREQKIKVCLSTEDITSEGGSRRLMEEAIEQGPVGGIFHLAMVS